MENITFDALLTAVLVVLALCGGVVTIDKAVDAVKKWRHPQMQKDAAQNAEIKKCLEKLERDNRRLDEHTESIKDLREGQRYLCLGVQALLEHELHNGNSDEMRDASQNIKAWLAER